MELLCSFCCYLAEADPTEQNITNTILGMRKLMDHGYLLHNPDKTMNALLVLTQRLERMNPTEQDVANTVFGMSKFVERGLNSEPAFHALCALVKRLPHLKPTLQGISNTLFGLTQFMEEGMEMDPETQAAALSLVKWLPNMNPDPLAIVFTTRFLSVLVTQKKIECANVDEIIYELLPFLEKGYYTNAKVTISEVLFSLSVMGFEDRDNWSNRLIKNLFLQRKKRGKNPVTSQNVLAQGVLGYARMMQALPDHQGRSQLFSAISFVQNSNTSRRASLALIEAHYILKEKGAEELANRINLNKLYSSLSGRDLTPEEKKIARLVEEKPLPVVVEEVIPVTGWCAMTQAKVYLTVMTRPTTYDLRTQIGQETLQKHLAGQGIQFIPEDVPIQICPIFVLQNQLGAFAATRLKAGLRLGNYLGDIVDQPLDGGSYAFENSNEKFIDGRYKRNFAAFVNHNPFANIKTPPSRNGEVTFCVDSMPIDAGEQCFINYGPDFFPLLGFEPLYLDPQDCWESFDQLVGDHMVSYLPHAAYLSVELQKVFRLPTQKVLLTRLSLGILSGNDEACLKLIEEEGDLWNYCVGSDNTILPPQTQQRFTSLMLACYLGRTRVVEALLEKGNLNRRLLQTGETAATFALKGRAEDRTALFKMLLDAGIFYNQTNREGENFLNIAVEENLPEVVKLLQDKKQVPEPKELLDTFAGNKTDSLYKAMVSGKMDAARLFLQKTTQEWLCTKIVDRELLVLKALEDTPFFEEALDLLIDCDKIHKNFGAVKAIMDRLGLLATKLLESALDAKQWPAKQRAELEAIKDKITYF
jgi:hypothetical protein